MGKRIFFITLFLWIVSWSAVAETTTYTFRFLAGKDMFFVPMADNEGELSRLMDCIDQHKSTIADGSTPLRVDGYCTSAGSDKRNLAVAAVRSNRVKSELIVRCGVIEDCFITHNHASEGDYVTVTITIPTDKLQPTEKAEPIKEEAVGETPTATHEPAVTPEEQPRHTAATETPTVGENHLSLRANLLRWATLTPDIGLEWRVTPQWSVVAHAAWTSWSWSDKDRRYALWEVMPEVRRHLGRDNRGYVGVMYKAGQFNYKLSSTGRQGDIMGGGITGGYRLKLNNCLSLDFSLAVGYLHADTEKYVTVNGVRVAQGKEKKNWWGPTNAGVTLVWTIF